MALDVPETGLNAAVAVIIIIFPLSEEVQKESDQYLRSILWRYQLPDIQ